MNYEAIGYHGTDKEFKLRCARYNGQYERFFAAYEEAHRENWEAKPLLSLVK